MRRALLALVVVCATSVAAGAARPPADHRTVWLLGADGEAGTVRVALDDSSTRGEHARVVYEVAVCRSQGDGFSTCAPTAYNRRRTDRHGVVKYSAAVRRRGRFRLSLRAKWVGTELRAFSLRYTARADEYPNPPHPTGRYTLADVTSTAIAP